MKSAEKSTAKLKPKKVPWNFLEIISFMAFSIWSAMGLYFTLGHVTPEVINKWEMDPHLKKFVNLCLQNGDVVLILLAFINTHLHAVRQWAAGAARAWAAIVVCCAYAIEYCGAATAYPFGEYHYTTHFGPMLWLVPITIPLAWHIILTNTLFVFRAVIPHAMQLTEAIMVGILCTAYDFILEPFATTLKHYWNWADDAVPIGNYIAWFMISALLIRVFAPTLSTLYRLDPRPWLILALTIAIFIAGEMK